MGSFIRERAKGDFSRLMNEKQKEIMLLELARIKPELAHLRQTNQSNNPRFTDLADRAFNISLHLLIAELGPVSMSSAANETAFDLGVSPVTAARYLEKHITRHAHFKIDRRSGLVICRDCTVGISDQDEAAPSGAGNGAAHTVRRRRRTQGAGNGKIRGEVIDRMESKS